MFEGWSVQELRDEAERREEETSALRLEIALRGEEAAGFDTGLIRRNLKSEILEISRMICEKRNREAGMDEMFVSNRGFKVFISEMAYHRNGISGAPFHVLRFQTFQDGEMDEESPVMFGIVFEKEGHVAVFDIDLLTRGTIASGCNSWRGDYYEPLLREYIKEKESGNG